MLYKLWLWFGKYGYIEKHLREHHNSLAECKKVFKKMRWFK